MKIMFVISTKITNMSNSAPEVYDYLAYHERLVREKIYDEQWNQTKTIFKLFGGAIIISAIFTGLAHYYGIRIPMG
jgi:hypothetical protein